MVCSWYGCLVRRRVSGAILQAYYSTAIVKAVVTAWDGMA